MRRTLPAHFTQKSHLTDTAGVPWKGRDYTVSPFPTDTGGQDPRIAAALAAVDAGEDPHHEALVAALRGQRVMVPITAIATDTEVTADGLVADNASDMAVVKIQAGTDIALPIFTGTEQLTAWRPEARPVPMVIEQAAQAAVAEGCTMLIVDMGRPRPVVLTRSALWALGQDRPWTPPHADDAVISEMRGALLGTVPHLRDVHLRPHPEREVDVVLVLEPGLRREDLQAILGGIQQILASSQLIAERVTSLKLTVTG
ncbi:SseB family protein [Helcobacillus massiliensis]|uniref:SseB protein N-terminal domain-containing protein n=1 Tax=Helcobacillus massiliensis TaxID=521392 RepID=A0A839QSP9_9MICO|nr:SseB family protein [Helcobacillus massiliensis]MCG7427107.1 SseB family protein [Helcobacillus sp. ACRRO]MBB3021859.1 hypothetical protein [Helcobacillus massiliensis]MCT1557812.1 SseB family protein [Helcobacillus massiliensis]MCT2036692.1 SseB family protein [Helcobacillus massiliensis]MCT2332163.1 SseB family protein [Helcobacillus massiliensis]